MSSCHILVYQSIDLYNQKLIETSLKEYFIDDQRIEENSHPFAHYSS